MGTAVPIQQVLPGLGRYRSNVDDETVMSHLDKRKRDATRILLVDDHEMFRTALAESLGLESDLTVVAQAGSGAEALAAASSGDIDLAIVDHRLPDVDGATLCGDLVGLQILCLMLTSSAIDETLSAIVERNGITAALSKGAAWTDLVAAVRAAEELSIPD